MDLLPSLREQLAQFVPRREELKYRYAAGLSPTLPLASLYREFPLLVGEEALASVREALAGGKAEGVRAAELAHFDRVLPLLALEAAAASEEEALAQSWAQPAVGLPHEVVPAEEARARILRDPSFDLRHHALSALAARGRELDKLFARRTDARLERLRSLRVRPQGEPPGAVTSQGARELLQVTEDAYRDVLGYALKRLVPGPRPLRPAEAALPEVLHVASTPWLRSHFSPAETFQGIRQMLHEVRLEGSSVRRLELDRQERASGRLGASAFAAPEGRVTLFVRTSDGGARFCLDWLRGFGQALALAELPDSTRGRLAMAGRSQAAEGTLFALFPTTPAWHIRYLSAPRSNAVEGSRLCGLILLARLRFDCARAQAEAELEVSGAGPRTVEQFEELAARALQAPLPRELARMRLRPRWEPFRGLTDWAAAGASLNLLEERFNEDCYRNPSAGAFLQNRWAAAGVPPSANDAELRQLGLRLVQTLGR